MSLLRMSIVLVVASMFSSSAEAQLFRFRPNPTFNARLNSAPRASNFPRLIAAQQQLTGGPQQSRFDANAYQFSNVQPRANFIPSQRVAPLQRIASPQRVAVQPQTPACNREQQQTILVPVNNVAALRPQPVQVQQRQQVQQVQVQVRQQQPQVQQVQRLQPVLAVRPTQTVIRTTQTVVRQARPVIRQSIPSQPQGQLANVTYLNRNTGQLTQRQQYLRAPVQSQILQPAVQLVQQPAFVPAQPASPPLVPAAPLAVSNLALDSAVSQPQGVATTSFETPLLESQDIPGTNSSEFSVLNSGLEEAEQSEVPSVMESAVPPALEPSNATAEVDQPSTESEGALEFEASTEIEASTELDAPVEPPVSEEPGSIDLEIGEIDLDLPPLDLDDLE